MKNEKPQRKDVKTQRRKSVSPNAIGAQKIYPHSYLLTGSSHTLEQGENAVEGSTYNFLASMLFTAFAIEAYLNEVGEEKVSDWKNIERKKTPKEKLLHLCELENYKLDLSKRPFQTFIKIFEFRDLVVHAKPEEKTITTQIAVDKRGIPKSLPTSTWLETCNLQNATIYLDDTNKMLEMMHHELKIKGFSLIISATGHWRMVDVGSEK